MFPGVDFPLWSILLLSPPLSCLLSPVSSHLSSCVRPSIISVATPAVKTGRATASGSGRRIWGANYFDGPSPPSHICWQRRYRASAADTRDAGFNYLSNVDIARRRSSFTVGDGRPAIATSDGVVLVFQRTTTTLTSPQPYHVVWYCCTTQRGFVSLLVFHRPLLHWGGR